MPDVSRLSGLGCGLVATHSSVTGRLNALLNRLAADEALASEWRSATDLDPRDLDAVSQLLLGHALHANPDGIVVFFSSKPDHIVENVRRVREARFDRAQIERLDEFATRPHVRAFFASMPGGLP